MRGDGFLYLRGSVWHASYPANGKRVRLSLRTDQEVEARELLRKLRATSRAHALEARAAVAAMEDGELDGAQVARLRGPIVYAWFRDGQPLYVGKGATGIARPLSQRHHRLLGILPTDKLRIWCCESAQHACHRELELIRALRPSLNVKHRARP